MSNTDVQITAEELRFSYYCDQWLELCRQRLKTSTHYKYSGIVNKYLKPEFGNLPLPVAVAGLLLLSIYQGFLLALVLAALCGCSSDDGTGSTAESAMPSSSADA